MKIAVMGAGALGGYFGGRLAASGADVGFVARGAHLAALRRDGLRIESPLGDLRLPRVAATDAPAEIGPVDLVLFLVKLYDTEAAAAAIRPLIGPQTAVLTLQNGIDAWERIGAVVGAERVMAGAAYIPADVRAPGIVRHSGPFARIVFGEIDGAETPRLGATLTALRAADVEASISDDILATLWEKFILLSALSATTALTRSPIGPIRDEPEAWALFEACVDETFHVGKAAWPSLADAAKARALEIAKGFPDGMRASMLDDLERGKPLELEGLSGAVVRLGGRFGLATPSHRVVEQALRLYANGKAG